MTTSKTNGGHDKKGDEMILEQISRFFGIVWRTGNFWGRIFILLIVGWPFLLAFTSAVGGGVTFTSLLALMPFFAIVAGIAAYPVISAALVYFDKSRAILGWIAAIIGTELAIGAYFSALPLSNDRGLAPLLVLVIAALILLSLAKKLASVRTVLWIALVILTLIFAFGGREAIKEKAEANYHPPTHPAPYPQDYNKKETRRFEYAEPGGGVMVKLQTNCDREDFIAVIPPRHKINLHHVYFAETVKANRCSYDVYGRSFPIYGPSDDWQTKEEFAGDLVAPQFKAMRSLIKFLHPNMRTAYQGIKRDGDSISAENCSDGEIRIYHVYNVSKGILFSGSAQQIGHDGSTVTFEGTITPTQCPGI